MGILGQTGSPVRLEWGPSGVEALGAECAVLIVVGRGAAVVPLREPEERPGMVLAGTGPRTPLLTGGVLRDD